MDKDQEQWGSAKVHIENLFFAVAAGKEGNDSFLFSSTMYVSEIVNRVC